ncbi:MAG: ribosome maturation factor RimM [Desulfobacteraceae bacterium]|jgi:16S rRNA processing protein RimM|nr:ribosome maturation factor RimM [Desulfobacteraceae bacterium]
MDKRGYVLIGKIVGVHGLKGTNKFKSYAESLSVFYPGQSILIRDNQNRETSVELNWIKSHTGTPLISFKGVTDFDRAEALIGAEIFIPETELPELDEDTYYWFELIGIEVYNTEEDYLGRITSIFPTGSNDVYVVKNKTKEVLIPALESVVIDIDLELKRMRVDLPEGLI